LDDLTEAHHQLTQLNHLAHDLRWQAGKARRSKEQFVANMRHELCTPLNMTSVSSKWLWLLICTGKNSLSQEGPQRAIKRSRGDWSDFGCNCPLDIVFLVC